MREEIIKKGIDTLSENDKSLTIEEVIELPDTGSSVRDESFIRTYGWMNRLGLDHTERDVFAVIYSYSQNDQIGFWGLTRRLEEWSCSKKTKVYESLNHLQEMNLISKRMIKIQGQIRPLYRSIYDGEKQFRHTEEGNRVTKLLNTFSATQTASFRNTDGLSSPRGDNNKANNKFNNTAAVIKTVTKPFPEKSEDVSPSREVTVLLNNDEAAAALLNSISKKIKDLFGFCSYPESLLEKVGELTKRNGLTRKETSSYLDFVFERTGERKASNRAGMFRTLILQEDIMKDFLEKNKKQKEEELKAEKSKCICPVCGEENPNSYGECWNERCRFYLYEGNSFTKVRTARSIYALTDEKKKAFEDELRAVILKRSVTFFLNPEEKKAQQEEINEIYKKYNVIPEEE